MKLPDGKVSAKERRQLCSQGGGEGVGRSGARGGRCSMFTQAQIMEELSIDSY